MMKIAFSQNYEIKLQQQTTAVATEIHFFCESHLIATFSHDDIFCHLFNW